jgi:hypothetical protein
MKSRRRASCIRDDFENDNVRRTKRAARRRGVRSHRPACAVRPDSFPTAECRSGGGTFGYASRQSVWR